MEISNTNIMEIMIYVQNEYNNYDEEKLLMSCSKVMLRI